MSALLSEFMLVHDQNFWTKYKFELCLYTRTDLTVWRIVLKFIQIML